MAKWLVKITHYKGQCKISIPKSLAGPKGLFKAQYLILDDTPKNGILLRRFEGGESFNVVGKKYRHPTG